jgi:hypothetical protein
MITCEVIRHQKTTEHQRIPGTACNDAKVQGIAHPHTLAFKKFYLLARGRCRMLALFELVCRTKEYSHAVRILRKYESLQAVTTQTDEKFFSVVSG